MQLRKLTFAFALFAALWMASPSAPVVANAEARSGRKAAKRARKAAAKHYRRRRAHKRRRLRRKRRWARRRRRRRGGYYRCRWAKRRGRKRRRKRCRFVRYFQGRRVKRSELRRKPLPPPSGRLVLYNIHFRKTVKVDIYDDGGELDDGALAALDHNFRCWRTNNERAVDPRLYEMLSRIYDHFGKRRIELVSGFRFQRNEGSRHFHGSAADIRISGVSTKALYDYARSLDKGGMGIGMYPRGGFVHIDFRAPGEASYRWVDKSPGGSGNIRRYRGPI